ncbi:MAG: class I SAM-dependent methyltransferase [Microcoleaceae cyanobacterium]
MNNGYQQDLAYIHDIGFSDHAINATTAILNILHQYNIKNGLIVELGCGSGISAQAFIDANYQVLGIDISEAMINIARQRVPEATFQVNSLLKVDIPSCQVIVSIGECLNYLFDADNTIHTLSHLFQRIYQALTPGGLFIFDILEPQQLEIGKTQHFVEGEDWIVLVEKTEDKIKQQLTRRIISFRQLGEMYRREEEVHQVQLYSGKNLAEELGKIGFQVEIKDSYGEFKLRKHHSVIIAQK